MRYKFATLSGSQYMIDTAAMTWKRRNVVPGHEDIMGLPEVRGGALFAVPSVLIGWRARLVIGPGTDAYITTTPVQRIELLDD